MAQYQPGYVVWVKTFAEVDRQYSRNSDLDVNGYKHPALVISSARPDQRLPICLLTSLGDRPFGRRWPNEQAYFWPVEPSPPTDTWQEPLRMKHERLPRSSYVDIKRVIMVDARILGKFPGRESQEHYQLENSSFKLVLKELKTRGLVPREQSAPRIPTQPVPLPLQVPVKGSYADAEYWPVYTPLGIPLSFADEERMYQIRRQRIVEEEERGEMKRHVREAEQEALEQYRRSQNSSMGNTLLIAAAAGISLLYWLRRS